MSVAFTETYEISDLEAMDPFAFLKWTLRERAALERLMKKILEDEHFEPGSPLPVIFDDNIGNIVDTFTFLDVPIRRTIKYRSGSRPENAGVGRHIIDLEVFADCSD